MSGIGTGKIVLNIMKNSVKIFIVEVISSKVAGSLSHKFTESGRLTYFLRIFYV